jgi:hypothetical protein
MLFECAISTESIHSLLEVLYAALLLLRAESRGRNSNSSLGVFIGVCQGTTRGAL